MTFTMFTRRAALLAFTASLSLAAQPLKHPDFSGVWKLNKEKSVYGKIPMPDEYTMKVAHNDPALDAVTTLKNPFGEYTSETKLKTDGSANTNTQGRVETKSTISWQGAVMVMKTVTVITMGDQKQEAGGEERWELSADGKMLTVTASMKGPNGEITIKRVLDRAAN